ncbi:nicotinate (nicotinamide) nucleotide adenylyltransferase [Rhizosphaericola mali]|uniref:Probable nicotinate-nucleotide adenylyltransferase n=1 Tax=Rhizosphaericola mali TaxID=2545455 RepID=A0A5P2G3G7_9BACT|nr:nicotinate (nicotinamide) nucleotide adenylyltransferase [Rhizosphaericola mali]QES90374.1 nicotinate-nucleotide adenylyltransferase [Rhizosphaericola mali]
MKIGLYFGSFNPIHNGHLIIAQHVLNNSDLDQIWFVVSPQNPFKPSKTLLNEYDRLNLVEIAIADNNRFKTSDIEFKLPKPSYTIDSITYLREKYPNNKFTIIVGGDSYQNIGKWKNSELLLSQNDIIVYARPGFELNLKAVRENITFLTEVPLLNISATYIRSCIIHKQSIQYLTPDNVIKEIEKNGYFERINLEK